MYKFKSILAAICILSHITCCQSNNTNTSNVVTRNVSFQDEKIKPRFANFLSKIKKESSVTPRYNDSDDEFEGPTFLDRILEAQNLDAEDDPENFEWLRKVNQFNRNSTGIIYTGQMDPKDLTPNFCRVLALKEAKSTDILLNTISKIGNNTICGSNWQVVLDLRILDQIPSSLVNLSQTNTILLISDTFDGSLIQNFTQKLKAFGVKYGYSFDADKYENYLYILDYKFKPYVYHMLSDPNSVMYNFYFQEKLENIQAGAKKMFRRRKVLFEECRKWVVNNRDINHRTEIGFTLTRYYKSKDFYKSPRDLQTFVKYINLLSNWTESMDNTVVFVGRDLDTEGDEALYNQTAGWYSLDENSNKFITKREQALDLSIAQYMPAPVQNGLSNQSVILIAGVPLVFVILLSVSAVYFLRNYYKTNRITSDEINRFLHGNENAASAEFYNLPYDQRRYEIPEDYFIIEEDEPLGSGEFGRVCRGTITKLNEEIKVAVKYPNPLRFHRTTVHGLLSEIKVLAYLGKHQNISELLGANVAKLKQGKVFIFLELCELGSLEKYLRDFLRERITQGNSLEKALSDDMFRWSNEICNGMSYLVAKHVVHADLATRNVLLNQNREAKLCDFGLSKRMLNYSTCVETKQELLPWKWMAIESLTSDKFSEKTDVWAFGVTLWEIYSLSDIPYPGLSWKSDFPTKLVDGFRLSEPKYNERDMYMLMKNCWHTKPDERPTFSCLRLMLKNWGDGGAGNYAIVK